MLASRVLSQSGGNGSGKRRQVEPLSSSSDEDDSLHSPRSIAGALHIPVCGSEDLRQEGGECLEESDVCPPSPDTSSTSSGSTLVRVSGFCSYAHKLKLTKKKSKMAPVSEQEESHEANPRAKPRRDPVPMRRRALPVSFWQQPNKPPLYAPSASYQVLPPLFKQGDEDLSEIRPITPPEERDKQPSRRGRTQREVKVTQANSDLLFKLFESVDKKATRSKASVLRSRRFVSTSSQFFQRGEDPYLIDSLADAMLPMLSLSQRHAPLPATQTLQLVSIKDSDNKTVILPSLQTEQNYAQALSELVVHL